MSDLRAVRTLIELVAATLERAEPEEPGTAAEVAYAVALLRETPVTPFEPRPARPPGYRHWGAALACAEAQGQAVFAAALRPFGEALGWSSGEAYYGEAGTSFGSDVAFADVVGEHGGVAVAGRYELGLGVLGPQVYYPPHWHDSTEIYCVVAGEGEWKLGRRGLEAAPASERHPPCAQPASRHARRRRSLPARLHLDTRARRAADPRR